MTHDLARRMPFGSARLPNWPDLSLRGIGFVAQTNVRVQPDSGAARDIAAVLGAPLPLQPNTWTAAGRRVLVWLGPDEWLIIDPEGSASGTMDLVRAAWGNDWGSSVDVSANSALIELSGACARDLLARGCPLDLHPRVFKMGTCAQSLLARVPIVLIQRSSTPSYWLLVRSSFAAYVADWLVDAAAEFAPRVEEAEGAAAAEAAEGASVELTLSGAAAEARP